MPRKKTSTRRKSKQVEAADVDPASLALCMYALTPDNEGSLKRYTYATAAPLYSVDELGKALLDMHRQARHGRVSDEVFSREVEAITSRVNTLRHLIYTDDPRAIAAAVGLGCLVQCYVGWNAAPYAVDGQATRKARRKGNARSTATKSAQKNERYARIAKLYDEVRAKYPRQPRTAIVGKVVVALEKRGELVSNRTVERATADKR